MVRQTKRLFRVLTNVAMCSMEMTLVSLASLQTQTVWRTLTGLYAFLTNTLEPSRGDSLCNKRLE